MRLRADIGIMDILGHLLIWFFLTIITLGVAAVFFPYSFAKFILNRCAIEDEAGNFHDLNCEIEIFGNIGHAILWFFISMLTLGIGYIFYFYRVWNYAINRTYRL